MKKRPSVTAALAVALTLLMVMPLMASSSPIVQHVPGAAAKSCQQLAPEGADWQQLKVDGLKHGTYGNGDLKVKISHVKKSTFDWQVVSGPSVDAVYVKSGSRGSNLYLYDPPATKGKGLRPPSNQAVSHVLFCYTLDVNQPPQAVGDDYATDEDSPLIVDAPGILENDTDPEGAPLTVGAVNGSAGSVGGTVALPSGAMVAVAADGSFVYDPNGAFDHLGDEATDTDTFTYQASDGAKLSTPATVTITINGINDAPVAVDDEYSTDEKSTLTVPAAGVLANDTDAEDDSLTASLVTGPSLGQVTLNPDGSFTYDPEGAFDHLGEGESATDAFTYQASDGALSSNVATVTITITGVNDAPVAVDDEYSTGGDSPFVVDAGAGLLANDSDLDGDDLTVDSVDDAGLVGTVVVAGDGSFTYTPAPGASGYLDTFTYTVTDGIAESNEATVTIVVPLACGVSVEFGGEGAPSYTVIMRPEDGCPPKDAAFDAGLIEPESGPEGGQFVELQPRPVGSEPDSTVYAFLERIEWLPVALPGGVPTVPYVLEYNDFVFDVDEVDPALLCLLDPRDGAFDLDAAIVASEIAAYESESPSAVLPPGETTCIVSVNFDITAVGGGSELTATYILFNIGDGLRTFK